MREEPVAGKLQKMQAGSATVKFAPAPFLPEWLQEEPPHKRVSSTPAATRFTSLMKEEAPLSCFNTATQLGASFGAKSFTSF